MPKEQKRTETIETEQTTTELTYEGQTLRSMVQWQPKAIELVYGLTIPAGAPPQQIAYVRHITDQYTKSRAVGIDEYLGAKLTLCGCIMVMGTVRNDDKEPFQPIIDSETGEYSPPSPYTSQYRQIFKVCGVNGEACKPFYIKFMASSVEKEVVEFFYPVYGPGDWQETTDFEITQVSTGRGRAYNFKQV